VFPPPCVKDFSNLLFDHPSIPFPETERCADDNRFCRQVKTSVFKTEFFLPDGTDRTRVIQQTDRFDNVLDLSPVGPGIHPDGAAHASGDAGAECHPGQCLPYGQTHQFRQRATGPCLDQRPFFAVFPEAQPAQTRE